jgi:hypothetical protein
VAIQPHRALSLTELLAINFNNLSLSELRHASIVCSTWTAVATPLLWRSTTSAALWRLPSTDGRRQAYASYVRKLTVVDDLVHLTGDCRFPQLRQLSLSSAALCSNLHLLHHCGPLLASIVIFDSGFSSDSDADLPSGSLSADEVAALARLPSLVDLRHYDAPIHLGPNVSGGAAETVLRGVSDPFPALRVLYTTVTPGTLPLLLPLIGRLADLRVEVAGPYEAGTLEAVAEHVPGLQVFMMKTRFGVELAASDFLALRRLARLRILDLCIRANGGAMDVDD